VRKRSTLAAAYFDGLYSAAPDPWDFATSPYEGAKYDHTLLALGHERAASALEVGCSIGVLTRRLAARCDHLVATELSEAPLAAARRRCADLPNVEFRLVRSAVENFGGPFDLIVLSEVIYYWDDRDMAKVGPALEASLTADGRVLLVHWLGETDYPKSADDAVCALKALTPTMKVERADRRGKYRLDLWRGTDALAPRG